MGATSDRAKAAGDAASSVTRNPYVRRLLEDDELRDNIKDAFNAARDAYERMSNGRAPADALIDDKRVHRDLKEAAESIREASNQLRGKRKRRSGGIGRWLLIAAVGAILVVAFSEDVRKAILDQLFGAEEEFEYTSTTTAATEEQVPTT